jgi:murein L,D-transpeptidase YcbB/YkuD
MKNHFLLIVFFLFINCKNETSKFVLEPKAVSVTSEKSNTKAAIAIDSIQLDLFHSKFLTAFYNSNSNKSVWTTSEKRKIILEFLNKSDEEGLNSLDYSVKKLNQFELKYDSLSDTECAEYDVLLTYNLQKYISHLTNGRLNPKKLYKNWDLKENKIDLQETVSELLKTDSLSIKLEQLKPNFIVYKRLKKALKIINSFPNNNFVKIEIKGKLVLNDSNSEIVEVKKRLMYWKDLQPKDSLSVIYDTETENAMKKFQKRHGLAADGVIGKGTLMALNFSKNQRKEQIIANLERWKWFPKNMGNEFVIINIPEYRLTLIKNKDTLRVHKVIVGRAKRKTPVLSSKLTQAIFNPTWTVPPTILREDVIPAILKNRSYLAKTNIRLIDKNGNVVSARNWNLSDARSFRYVQIPGKFNSLGMVKLMFPNRFSVYLHDTNHRDFFEKNERSLSSGCVRVDNPLELTEYLLNDKENWNLEKITETLQNEKTKYVSIKKEVLFHLLYWTAWSEKNTLIFRDDIYNLDADLYQKLGNRF